MMLKGCVIFPGPGKFRSNNVARLETRVLFTFGFFRELTEINRVEQFRAAAILLLDQIFWHVDIAHSTYKMSKYSKHDVVSLGDHAIPTKDWESLH